MTRPGGRARQRAAAAPAAAAEAAPAVRPRSHRAAEHHQRRGRCPHPPVLGDGDPDQHRRRPARRADDAALVQRAVRGVRLPLRQPAARRETGIRGAAGGLLADRGRVRRHCMVRAAALHQRAAVRDRRVAVARRRAAVVSPQPGQLGDLRTRHRHGRLDRPGSRAQAAGRRLGQRPGRLGRAVGPAAAAAGGVRRRRRAGRGLQRPARRGAVHRRDPPRQHLPAGHRLLVDRDRHRLDLPARSRVYQGIPDYRSPGR